MMYKVLSNLRHNGEVFKKDDLIDLDSSIANNLIKDGVLKSTEEEADTVLLTPRVKKEKSAEKDEDKKDSTLESDGLEELTKAALMEIVEAEEIENVKASFKQPELVEAIRNARKEKSAEKDEDKKDDEKGGDEEL